MEGKHLFLFDLDQLRMFTAVPSGAFYDRLRRSYRTASEQVYVIVVVGKMGPNPVLEPRFCGNYGAETYPLGLFGGG